jgi:uncharacterized protein with HEPN domain
MTEQGRKYLSDILRAIELIEQFTISTSNFNDFLIDLKRKVQLKDN